MKIENQDINSIIENNRYEAEKLLWACKNCPHKGEDCLALNNQCPDE